MQSRHFFKYHFPFLLYALLVVGVSSIPNLSPLPLKFIATDKVAHFLEYSLFAYLAYNSFIKSFDGNLNKTLIASSLFLSVFAFSDELYQKFIPGRHFDLFDILFDLFGASLVLILLHFKQKRMSSSQ